MTLSQATVAAPTTSWTYESLKEAVRGTALPLVLIDLQRFDANVRYFAELAASHGKSVRIASKSLRVPSLLSRAFSVGGATLRGLMCYSATEAAYLADCGFDDLMIAYPTVQPSEIAAACVAVQSGKSITFTVDCSEHVRLLTDCWEELRLSVPLRVCIEFDVSWRPLGRHIGAQRSPLRTLTDFERLLDEILARPELEFAGVMGYEAQLAGVPDSNPFTSRPNVAARVMKRLSRPDVMKKRNRVHQLLEGRGVAIDFFNGGGTGSFVETLHEPWLTELTVGSGLFQPHLFDYYVGTPCKPALCFALAVTRCPQKDRVTCQGGGFIASGPTRPDRAPRPILPADLLVDRQEGCGEVQTPLVVPLPWRGKLAVGDPIFFRPAKAGEIAERFAEFHLMEGGRIVEHAATYRGLGQCFH